MQPCESLWLRRQGYLPSKTVDLYIYILLPLKPWTSYKSNSLRILRHETRPEHAGPTLGSTACGDCLSELDKASQVLAWSFAAFNGTMSEATRRTKYRITTGRRAKHS